MLNVQQFAETGSRHRHFFRPAARSAAFRAFESFLNRFFNFHRWLTSR
jgi:hypothetical protein